MAPIRVALIGLSASAKTSWAAKAHLPYLLSSRGKKSYELVALLNSSVEAAESAKMAFNLPTVKAYGDPALLAADPDIDIVVVNTRVDVHYRTVEPSIRAGKAVFIEWPLTENLATSLALTKNQPVPNSIIGLQGRVMPITTRLKELLYTDTIGKVLNSEVRAYGNIGPRDGFEEGIAYFAERKVGGNPINIHYGHTIDFVHEVLGTWESFHAKTQIQRPKLNIYSSVAGHQGVQKAIESDVPDYLSIHGTLANDRGVLAPNATLVATFRLGPQFKNDPGFVWTINGEKGELKLTAPGPFIFSGMSYDGPVKIEHHDHETDQVNEIFWDWQEWQKEFKYETRATAELYERFAEWHQAGQPDTVSPKRDWPRLEDGVSLMREFDELYKYFD